MEQIVEVSNLSLNEYKTLHLYCPKCNSTDIKRKFIASVSIYGYLPKSPVDLCVSCGFKSEESFSSINFREKRNYKLNQILDNGIQ